MEVFIEGDKIKTIENFHKEIKRALALPDYYGENLDALWDCLTGWIETPLTLVWKNFETSRHFLEGTAEKIISLFNDAENEVNGFKVEYL